MPRLLHYDDEDSDSRTSTVGSKRPAQRKGLPHSLSPSESLPPSRDFMMGNEASLHVAQSTRGEIEAAGKTATLSTSVEPNDGFGNNRLRSGFRKRPPPAPLPETSTSPGASAEEAIEISDDEENEEDYEGSDDDGGMLINIDGPPGQSLPEYMDLDDEEGESGQQIKDRVQQTRSSTRETPQSLSSTGREAHTQLQGDLDKTLNSTSDGSATHPEKVVSTAPLLLDLSESDLELQLKYAFFDIDPQTIDFNQRAVCLTCLQTDHAEQDCPEVVCVSCSGSHPSCLCPTTQRCTKCRIRGHAADSCSIGLKVTTVPCEICGGLNHVEQTCPQRFFAAPDLNNINGPLELWISCSTCASRSHLVGDCPRTDAATAARWSLKAFPPNSIVNLSTAAGMERIEEAAANRGLRPEGLQIRGRAGLHNAGAQGQTEDSDDGNNDGQFLRPSVKPRGVSVPGAITMTSQLSQPKPTMDPKQKQLQPVVPRPIVQRPSEQVPSFSRTGRKKPVVEETVVEQPGVTHRVMKHSQMPSQAILREFVDAINDSRLQEDKGPVKMSYKQCVITLLDFPMSNLLPVAILRSLTLHTLHQPG